MLASTFVDLVLVLVFFCVLSGRRKRRVLTTVDKEAFVCSAVRRKRRALTTVDKEAFVVYNGRRKRRVLTTVDKEAYFDDGRKNEA